MTALLRAISDQAVGLTVALLILSAYIAGARIDSPSETDALQRSADIGNDRAAEHAAMKGPR
ncbi:hypothetical protein SAMN05518669_103399 [Variovorax sp. YR634]|uniref:hypothetical protein n=1 Tax=Variovorax sp. YR634 TaxID=1884385 RepID=UPI000895D5D9|nr:hypothetical protein [Variovorax sp. YR634]SDX14679.1 hypothetical protein SAMN05518669_103399 [Variovorax sp. YR634]